MEFQNMLMMQGTLFLLILVGVGAKRLKIVRSEDKRVLTDLVVEVFLPASIVNSFQMHFNGAMAKNFGFLIGLSVVVLAISYFLGALFFFRESHRRNAVLRYGTLISNGGFIGMPVAESFYGSLGLMYASVYLVPIRMAIWTLGLSFFTQEKDFAAGLKKVAAHPCLIAVYIGFGMMIADLQFIEPIGTTVAMIGKCTTPVIMILIGVIVGEAKDLKAMFSKVVVGYSLIRLVLLPGIIYGLVSLLHVDSTVAGIAVVMAAMPAGTSTFILAAKYEGDHVLAMEMVVVSTLISMVTIPIWRMIL